MHKHLFLLALFGCASAAACGGSGGGGSAMTDDAGDGGQDGSAEGAADGPTLMNDAPAEATGDASEASLESSVDSPPDGSDASDASDASDGEAGLSCGWTAYNDGLSGAAITDLLYDTRATPEVVYAAAGSSVFASSDGGQTWNLQGTYSGGINALATDTTDKTVLLAASGSGVLRSSDSGKTWSLLSLGSVEINSIAVAPSQSLRMYAGVRGAGVFRSNDGGTTWSAVSNGYPNAQTLSLAVAPDNPDEVVAGALLLNSQGGASGNGEILRSTDGGDTWSPVDTTDGSIWAVRRCASNVSVLYAGTDKGLSVSTDRGATWTLTPLPHLVEDVAISAGGCADVYAMEQNVGPIHSTNGAMTDGGLTFGSGLTTGLNLVPPGTWPGRMVSDPQQSGNLLVGSHGGIWYTTNGGTGWTGATGLLEMQVRGLGTTPLDPNRLWLTSWGSGAWQRASSSSQWQRISSTQLPVDYTLAAYPDPYTANRVFIGAWATLYQSSNNGAAFTADSLQETEFGITVDPNDSNVVYAATQLNGVYKSINGGSTWAPSNGTLTPWVTDSGTFIDVRSVVVDPASSQTIYIGTNGAGVYKSTDGGGSWTNVLEPTGQIGCLVLARGTGDAAVPETLYACVAGGGIEMTSDGGANWSDDSDGLPTLDVVGLAYDATSATWYATTGSGVYTQHGTQSWAGLDTNCLTGAGPVALLGSAGSRSLAVAARGGVYVHPL